MERKDDYIANGSNNAISDGGYEIIGFESITINHNTEIDWNGRAYISGSIIDAAYNAFFDKDNLTDADKDIIFSIGRGMDTRNMPDGDYFKSLASPEKLNEYDITTGDVVNPYSAVIPCDKLSDGFKNEVKKTIMHGEFSGDLQADTQKLSWEWEPYIYADGQQVDFVFDLSHGTKETILQNMLDNGLREGKTSQLMETDIDITLFSNQNKGDVNHGILETYNYFTEETQQFQYEYNPEADKLIVNNPDTVVLEAMEEIRTLVRKSLSKDIENQKLDEFITAAEYMDEYLDEMSGDFEYDAKPITALLVKPFKNPEEVTITDSLDDLQKAVDGNIEMPTYLKDDAILICNADGKNNLMMPNRALTNNGEYVDIIHGPFLIAGSKEDELISLTPDQITHYSSMFEPEFVEIHEELCQSVSLDDVLEDAEEKAESQESSGKNTKTKDELEY